MFDKSLFWAALTAVLASFVLVVGWVDLSPRVESDFFFSTEDPQLQASQEIERLFPSEGQLLISARASDVRAPEYVEKIAALTEALMAVDGISAVQSLTQGPSTPQSVAQSPVWSRLLLGAEDNLTQLIATVEKEAEEESGPELIARVDQVLAEHHSPSFALDISGVPYVVELIRRALSRDLRSFSLAALLIFGLLIAAIYRSPRIIVGTLLSCLGACALTLTVLYATGTPIGLLTANIITIVFVLTLSHIVFLTANWRQEQKSAGGADTADNRLEATRRAVALTFQASIWCMVTTLLGFGSLLFANAKPLRELGFAGAVGAAIAIFVAYGLYPGFLRSLARAGAGVPSSAAQEAARPGRYQLPAWGAVAIAAAVVVAGFGLMRVETDPNLLSYFAADSELRAGLEVIDRNGGSSPLLLVVRDPQGERLDSVEPLERMAALQAAFDQDPEVGSGLSLPILLEEAKRAPMAFLLVPSKLLDVLDTPAFGNITSRFVTPDRMSGLYFLRMHETTRSVPRAEVIDRLSQLVADNGLEIQLLGGLYPLQSALSSLVANSLLRGLGGLLLLFIPIAIIVSHRGRTAAAMIGGLVAVPVVVLGGLGHLGLPLDIISSPAANVAIAVGIDAMIHLAMAVRRAKQQGLSESAAWSAAVSRLAPAILGATSILAIGFGIFVLSSFPPTQRFGLAVAAGTVAAAVVALWLLPFLAGRSAKAS